MILVDRTGRRPDRYALRREERLIGGVTLGPRMSGGTFEVDGVAYEVRAGGSRGSYDLLAADGSVPATAERVHRRRWSLRTADGPRTFRRSGLGRVESLTDPDGTELGRITRPGRRSDDAVVDLPGPDVPVQAFALTLVLMRRRRRRRIATRTAAVSVVGR